MSEARESNGKLLTADCLEDRHDQCVCKGKKVTRRAKLGMAPCGCACHVKRKPTELSAKDLDYQTPEKILALARDYFDGTIPLDPATSWSNPAQARFICTGPHTQGFAGAPGVDGLAVSWRLPGFQKQGVWTNPPWGHLFKPFVAKILAEALASPDVPMLVLLPVSRTEQQYLTDVFRVVNALCFIRKRVPFVRPDTGLPAKGNPYNSWLLGVNVDVPRFFRIFSVLGRCLSVSPEPL